MPSAVTKTTVLPDAQPESHGMGGLFPQLENQKDGYLFQAVTATGRLNREYHLLERMGKAWTWAQEAGIPSRLHSGP